MRLIDADALKKELEVWVVVINQPQFYNREEALYIIDSAPSADAVPVVRCKDCKHNGTWQCHMEYDEYHPEADIHHEMHGDDDFCSYGEKEAT